MRTALCLSLLLVSCGSSSSGGSETKDAQTGWCGVEAAPLTSDAAPGVLAKVGWNGHLPIVIKASTAITAEQWQQIESAQKTWETALGRELFKPDGNDDRTGESFTTVEASLDDKLNGHYLDSSWGAHTGKGKDVLGTTVFRPGTDGAIGEADIRYNTENYIFGDATKIKPEGGRIVVDLESLALHELGHFLGLGHIGADVDKDSIMQTATTIGVGYTSRKPSAGDIERLRSIYK